MRADRMHAIWGSLGGRALYEGFARSEIHLVILAGNCSWDFQRGGMHWEVEDGTVVGNGGGPGGLTPA